MQKAGPRGLRTQGAAGLSGTLGKVWAPAVYTFLAMNWGAAGWLVIAGIIVVATIGVHPSTRLARRFLEKHVPADVLADARASSPDPEDGIAVGPPSLFTTDEPVPDPPPTVADVGQSWFRTRISGAARTAFAEADEPDAARGRPYLEALVVVLPASARFLIKGPSARGRAGP